MEFKLTQAAGTTRRITFSEQPTWYALAMKIETLFGIEAHSAAVEYTDTDGDKVTINTGDELDDYFSNTHVDGEIVKFGVVDLAERRPGATPSFNGGSIPIHELGERTPPTTLPGQSSSMDGMFDRYGAQSSHFPDISEINEHNWQMFEPVHVLDAYPPVDEFGLGLRPSTPPHIELVESSAASEARSHTSTADSEGSGAPERLVEITTHSDDEAPFVVVTSRDPLTLTDTDSDSDSAREVVPRVHTPIIEKRSPIIERPTSPPPLDPFEETFDQPDRKSAHLDIPPPSYSSSEEHSRSRERLDADVPVDPPFTPESATDVKRPLPNAPIVSMPSPQPFSPVPVAVEYMSPSFPRREPSPNRDSKPLPMPPVELFEDAPTETLQRQESPAAAPSNRFFEFGEGFKDTLHRAVSTVSGGESIAEGILKTFDRSLKDITTEAREASRDVDHARVEEEASQRVASAMGGVIGAIGKAIGSVVPSLAGSELSDHDINLSDVSPRQLGSPRSITPPTPTPAFASAFVRTTPTVQRRSVPVPVIYTDFGTRQVETHSIPVSGNRSEEPAATSTPLEQSEGFIPTPPQPSLRPLTTNAGISPEFMFGGGGRHSRNESIGISPLSPLPTGGGFIPRKPVSQSLRPVSPQTATYSNVNRDSRDLAPKPLSQSQWDDVYTTHSSNAQPQTRTGMEERRKVATILKDIPRSVAESFLIKYTDAHIWEIEDVEWVARLGERQYDQLAAAVRRAFPARWEKMFNPEPSVRTVYLTDLPEEKRKMGKLLCCIGKTAALGLLPEKSWCEQVDFKSDDFGWMRNLTEGEFTTLKKEVKEDHPTWWKFFFGDDDEVVRRVPVVRPVASGSTIPVNRVAVRSGKHAAINDSDSEDEDDRDRGLLATPAPMTHNGKPLPESYQRAMESHKRARESKERLESAKAEYIEAKKIYRAEKEQLKKQKEEAAKEWEDKKRRLKLERQIAKEETRRRFASGTGLHHLSQRQLAARQPSAAPPRPLTHLYPVGANYIGYGTRERETARTVPVPADRGLRSALSEDESDTRSPDRYVSRTPRALAARLPVYDTLIARRHQTPVETVQRSGSTQNQNQYQYQSFNQPVQDEPITVHRPNSPLRQTQPIRVEHQPVTVQRANSHSIRAESIYRSPQPSYAGSVQRANSHSVRGDSTPRTHSQIRGESVPRGSSRVRGDSVHSQRSPQPSYVASVQRSNSQPWSPKLGGNATYRNVIQRLRDAGFSEDSRPALGALVEQKLALELAQSYRGKLSKTKENEIVASVMSDLVGSPPTRGMGEGL